MDILLGDIATLVNGQLVGDPSIVIDGADTLRDAQPGQVTLADSPKLAEQLAASPASAVLVAPDFRPSGIAYVTVANVHEAFRKVVALFRPRHEERQVGISPLAAVSPTAQVGSDAVVHPLAVIGDHVEIGPRCVIHSGARIMAGCRLGEAVTVFPNAVLYENTVVGSRCLIHAGAVLGAYGFGYSTVDGRHQLSAQLGFVVIGDDVEIGAGTTIDRGTYGATVIGDGTKIDNLVMIAHNCRIGRHNILCSQVGIAGSATTGDYVVLAGQVGVRDHVHIGNHVSVGAKGGVIGDIPDGSAYIGIPATPERQQALILASVARLPELRKQVKDLQRLVHRLEQESGSSAAPDPSSAAPDPA